MFSKYGGPQSGAPSWRSVRVTAGAKECRPTDTRPTVTSSSEAVNLLPIPAVPLLGPGHDPDYGPYHTGREVIIQRCTLGRGYNPPRGFPGGRGLVHHSTSTVCF